MVGAEQAQVVGAPPLHEAQIIGVVHNAGEIRVLVIDANVLDMTAVDDLAVEGSIHRHGTCCCIAASQLRPSNDLGERLARSMPSRQRTLTSILSGSERGT